jgi:hypothetical protein
MMAGVKNPRVLLAAGIVVAAALLAVLFLPGGDGDTKREGDGSPTRTGSPPALTIVRAKPTLEQAKQADTGQPELLVSLPDPRLNTLALTGGESHVSLTCLDRGGEPAVLARVAWPLVEEPGYPPHIHQPAGQELLDRIESCRLEGPGMDFEGRVSGRLPVAE